MRSVILGGATRVLVGLILGFSVILLWRGHNAPGGGFVGGLVACVGLGLFAMSRGPGAVRAAIRIEPHRLAFLGLGCALVAGAIGPLHGRPFLSGEWITAAGVKLGSPLLFDVGVYLVVVGSVLGLLLALEEGDAS